LLDLSRLTEIRYFSASDGIAVIEPGVTQLQLARYVADTPVQANVTTSASFTSIVGNLLERGVGMSGQRPQDLLGLEVVTGAGDMVRVGGFWPQTSREGRALFYGPGVGPNLSQLFLQSNFGVVTAAAIALTRRPERRSVLRLDFRRERLGPVLRELRELYRHGVLRCVTRIYDDSAVLSYANSSSTPYRAYTSTAGPAAIEAAARSLLAERARMAGTEGLAVVDPSGPVDALERAVVACYAGDPSNNDEMIRAGFGVAARELDTGACDGWISLLPVVPFEIEAVLEATAAVASAFESVRARLHVTLNLLTERSIDLVLGIRFRREEAPSVHRAVADAWKKLGELGVRPYRCDIDNMAPAMAGCDASYRQLVEQVARAIDPNGIIAPGRYVIRQQLSAAGMPSAEDGA
jgi:4-cresol dehydrogenase (hydroxylating)